MKALLSLRAFIVMAAVIVGLVVSRSVSAAPPRSSPQATGASTDQAPPADDDSAPRPRLPWKVGPMKIDLGHDLSIDLSPEHGFLPAADAAKQLERMGNFHNENLLGLVTSQAGEEWFATLRYEAEGYIKDEEAIDASELLKAIREGTEEANPERVKRGFKALRIDGWSDPPRYDKVLHHLTWALDVSDEDGKSVNFNTRILGRHGFVSINLVTAPESLAQYKPQAAVLLQGTSFAQGARYQDFDKKTDKVAEYGLAGLVLGGAGLAAAKLVKIGLLAKFSKVIIGAIIAGKKAIIAGAVALVALLKKFFGRKKQAVAEGPPA